MKTFIYFSLLLSLCIKLSAQNPACEVNSFQKTYGRLDKYDLAMDIVETPDKGFITGGWGGDNNHCFLMKIDKKGNIVWSKQITEYNKQNGFLRKFIRLKDGNYIGMARSYRHSWTDTWIIKFDENGSIIWNRELTYPGGIGTDHHSIIETSDGGLAMAGWYQPYANVAGSLITKLDANGNFLWSKGCLGEVTIYDLLEMKGVLHVVGGDYSSKSGIVIKLNSSTGTLLSTKSFLIDNKRTALYSIREKNNKFYINAYSYALQSNDIIKQVILILDSDLNPISAQKFDFGFDRTWEFAAMFPTPDEGFIAAQNDERGSSSDVILYKVKQDGTVEWKRKYPRTGGEFMYSINPASDGGVIGLGVSNNYGSYYNYPNDILVLKTDSWGLTDCSVVDPDLTVSKLTVTTSTTTYDYKPMNFPIVNITSSTPSIITPVITLCEKIFVPTCNSLKISGSRSVCSIEDDVVYKAIRNDHCNVPVNWNVDPEFATIITSNDSTVTIKFRKAGIAKLKCSINDPCQPLSDSLYVNISNDPKKIDLGQDQSICPNNTLTLRAGPGFNVYQWQDGSNDSTFLVSQQGQFYVTATNRCDTKFSDTILINLTPPIAFDAGPDRIKCNNDTVHLSAPTGFLNYLWSNNYNISSTNTRNVVVYPSVDTFYYVKAEKTAGCFAFDTIHINVHSSPSIYLGNDRSFCLGDSVILNAGAGFQTYYWNNGESSQKTFIKTAGQYFVIGTTEYGCQSKDTLNILVHPHPIISLNKDTLTCSGYGKELDAGNFKYYNWSTGVNTRSIQVNVPGKYAVTVTDENGCINKDSVIIKALIPPPKNFLPEDTEICSYSSLTLRPTGNFTSYKWSDGTIASQIVINKPGTYSLQIKDKKGCIGEDSIIVSIKDCMTGVFIPNAFTPNKDGKNDQFKASVFGPIRKFELVVFNRWGEVVFKTKDPTKGWDGRFEGLEVQSDVYIWLCSYQMEGNEIQLEKGTVTLLH